MQLIICHDLDRLDASTLRRRLKKHGISIFTQKESTPEWDGKFTEILWRENLLRSIYKKDYELTDVVFFIPKEWKSTKSNLLGFAYRKQIESYFFSVIKHRKDWYNTAEHELLHVAYYFIYTYLGIKLEDVFDVDDFHEEVVHGDHPDYKEYNYDKVWDKVAPLLTQAVQVRKQMHLLSYREQLIVKLREYVLVLRGKISEMEGLLHPVEAYRDAVSYEYGVFDRRYSLTHRHCGSDYLTPAYTSVKAPWQGQVIVSGYSSVLGYYCHYTYNYEGQRYTDRYLHLKKAPEIKAYNRGEFIAHTGQSGQVTGAHLHIDVWVDDVDLTSINKNNWSQLTRDPQQHYVQ